MRKEGESKTKKGSERLVEGVTPKDYPCHLLSDKNTSSDVLGDGGKTL